MCHVVRLQLSCSCAVIPIAMASHKESRVYLSLEKKVEIIKHTQSNPGLSLRSLEILFGRGKT